VSEGQAEKKGEEKPDLEPFLGLIEHISRSIDLALSATSGLTDQILSTIEASDGIDTQKRIDVSFELGRILEITWLLHKFSLDDLAEGFYSRPKNVKRFMIIMSYLAQAYWSFKDGKTDGFATLGGAIEEARNNLEDYLIDVINSMLNDDYNDDDYSDDDSDDDGSQA